ncbi:serine protease [Corallincola holothuriorum]|uniref:Serine protease n=1 Tax=Corallincola holothuriorum TaxID=2282215 RepID=A0A368NNP2_9GAMM|nr:serine protease [Corallincola holothuriorum]RCU50921.1 serine protease [Corallincola holothuriorum]
MFRYIIPAALAMISVNSHAVVGGQTVSDQDWPYTVSLRQIEDAENNLLSDHRCGGAYIGDDLILTAAHCVELAPADNSVACIGHSGDAAENNCFKLFESVVHPDYDEQLYLADLAIYKLRNTYNELELPAATIITEQQDAQIQPGDILQILGLGSTSYEDYIPAYQLQGAAISIADEATCNDIAQVSAPSGFDASNYLCGGEQFKGPALGDSGTPAFVLKDGQYQYAALVSHGYNYMGIFTRLGDHLTWIEQTKAALTDPAPRLEVGPSQTWFLSDTHPKIEHTQVITNLSDEEKIIESIELAFENDIDLVAHDCSVLAPAESCSINLEANLPENNYERNIVLISTASQGLSFLELESYAESIAPGVENWEPPFQEWTVGDINRWAAIEGGIQNKEVLAEDRYLRGSLIGPATLSFSAEVSGASNYTQLSVTMDDNIVANFSGHCSAESMQIDIPDGEHVMEFHFKDTLIVEDESSITLSDFTLQEGTGDTDQLQCAYRTGTLLTLSEGDDTNGGSNGMFGIFSLLALTLIRRKFT